MVKEWWVQEEEEEWKGVKRLAMRNLFPFF
jgi:hypothetical protein